MLLCAYLFWVSEATPTCNCWDSGSIDHMYSLQSYIVRMKIQYTPLALTSLSHKQGRPPLGKQMSSIHIATLDACMYSRSNDRDAASADVHAFN